MAQLTSDELAKSVLAAHGAINLIALALVEKEAISDTAALDALKMIASSNHVSAKNLAETIEKLERLVSI